MPSKQRHGIGQEALKPNFQCVYLKLQYCTSSIQTSMFPVFVGKTAKDTILHFILSI